MKPKQIEKIKAEFIDQHEYNSDDDVINRFNEILEAESRGIKTDFMNEMGAVARIYSDWQWLESKLAEAYEAGKVAERLESYNRKVTQNEREKNCEGSGGYEWYCRFCGKHH